MNVSDPMSDREIWIAAGELNAKLGEMTVEYIFDQFSDVLGNQVAVENWRRIAAAVDAINDASARRFS